MHTRIVVADFTKPEKSTNDVVNHLKENNIDVGILVNNVGVAGGHHPMPFIEVEEQAVKNVINVNVLAATVLCHFILKGMKSKGRGAIINVSSSAAHAINPYLAIYCPTKHYISAKKGL